MSRLPSTLSTELPETSSVGRFEIGCETLSSPNHWIEELDDVDGSLQIECVPGQVFIFNGDCLRAPGFSAPEDKVAYAFRHVCHFLIDQIDNKGLEEVCRSLAEFYAYYRPIDDTRQLTDVRSKRATIGSRTISPAFSIGEE